MSRAASKLFRPIRVGNLNLSHRVVLAPLTRFRANDAHVPTDIMVDYYAQRASVPGALLITEATFIAPRAGGYDNVPGIWSDEQVAGWKKVRLHVHSSCISLETYSTTQRTIGDRCRSRAGIIHLHATLAAWASGEPEDPCPTRQPEESRRTLPFCICLRYPPSRSTGWSCSAAPHSRRDSRVHRTLRESFVQCGSPSRLRRC